MTSGKVSDCPCNPRSVLLGTDYFVFDNELVSFVVHIKAILVNIWTILYVIIWLNFDLYFVVQLMEGFSGRMFKVLNICYSDLFCLILLTESQKTVVFVISLFIFYYSHAGFELHIWPMHFLTFTK